MKYIDLVYNKPEIIYVRLGDHNLLKLKLSVGYIFVRRDNSEEEYARTGKTYIILG